MNRLVLTAAILFSTLPAMAAVPKAQQQTAGAETGQAAQAADTEVMENLSGQKGGDTKQAGAKLYQEHCAQCHNSSIPRAPHQSFLAMLPGDQILSSMNEGNMRSLAKDLTPEQRRQIAVYLAGSIKGKPAIPPVSCKPGQSPFDFKQPPFAKGWGIDLENTRFIPAGVARLAPASVPKLKLQWAFAYPNANRARSQPVLVGGTIVMGSQDGTVYSLDANTGCVRWTYRAVAEVRTGITVSTWKAGEVPATPPLAYFADLIAHVYAVNLLNGELVWMKKVDDHPTATGTAQPALYDGVVYQSVSSLEVVPAIEPDYECCTFRGSVVALAAATGEVIWKSHTIAEAGHAAGTTKAGTRIISPSGAPVWNTAAIDTKRKRLYVGTGENYSSPAEGSSDAIIAFDLRDGHILWIRQTTKNDAWNVACMPFIEDKSNCPAEDGPDFDYGAPPILVHARAGDIIVAGQKSGFAYGIAPDDGALIWQRQLGRGGSQGGIHFGMAAAGDVVFVPVADYDDGLVSAADAKPGIHAVSASTGEVLWSTITKNRCGEREDCDPGISAPVTAIPGVVFAGHMDGRLRAYDAKNGSVLWEFDADRPIKTISGEMAKGGSFGGGSGPIIANGHVYANSGYGIYFHMPGNVLLVFGTDKIAQ